MVEYSQAVGISSFSGRINSLLSQFTSLLVRIFRVIYYSAVNSRPTTVYTSTQENVNGAVVNGKVTARFDAVHLINVEHCQVAVDLQTMATLTQHTGVVNLQAARNDVI